MQTQIEQTNQQLERTRFYPLGVSRLWAITTEIPIYVDILKKEPSKLTKPGLLEIAITDNGKLPVEPGEYGSIILEGIVDDVLPKSDIVSWSWDITITCQPNLLITGLKTDITVFVHYPPSYVIGYPVQNSVWGVKIESGSGHEEYKATVEMKIPKFILESVLIDIEKELNEERVLN